MSLMNERFNPVSKFVCQDFETRFLTRTLLLSQKMFIYRTRSVGACCFNVQEDNLFSSRMYLYLTFADNKFLL